MRQFSHRFHFINASFSALALACSVAANAQLEGNADRGIPPVDSYSNFEVGGIEVDIAAKTADVARKRGWREAQRLGWRKLWKKIHGGDGPGLSDGALDSMVSGVVIEEELMSEHRYIAKLGITFDRARASEALGVGGRSRRSAPLLLLPVTITGGLPISFEMRNAWQQAWAVFRTDESPMDYVRATGNGADPLLLTVGQTTRPGRKWWRSLLDQYGAVDVLMAEVELRHSYPGGPVTGSFTARYGPDAKALGRFNLSANSSAEIPKMMTEGVKRIDAVFSAALAEGTLKPDTSLIIEQVITEEDLTELPPEKQEKKLQEGPLAIKPKETGEKKGPVTDTPPPPPNPVKTITVYVGTEEPGDLIEAESAIRGVPGVKSAATASTAIGGLSIVRVSFDGDGDMLKVALAARGYRVSGGGASIRIEK